MDDTRDADYTRRLARGGRPQWVDRLVQAPYRWNLRRQQLGVTLDVGCGVGRYLEHLPAGSLGVDHNPHSVEVARVRGLPAMTVDEWSRAEERYVGHFDSLLVAHVIEHLEQGEGSALLEQYLPALRPGGAVFLICPQERGYRSDPTHITWTTGSDLQALARAVGLHPGPWRSFPFPRAAGRLFTHNEFTLRAQKPVPAA